MSTVIEPQDPNAPGARFAAINQPSNGFAQPVPQPTGPRVHRLESLAIFVIFGALYGVLGYWLVVQKHVVSFDSLERLSDAYLAWHGSPPKLAAIGFTLPPLQSLVLLPFTLIGSMATSLVALPISSAIFGGLTIVALNRLLQRCDIAVMVRYPVLFLTALIPTLAFYSADGGAEMISMFFLAAGMGSLIAWFRTTDVRFLIAAGFALAFASLADYGDLIWIVLTIAMVAAVLRRHGAEDVEVEASVITYVAPTLFAIALWCLISWLIVDSPLGWITPGTVTAANAGGVGAAHESLIGAALTCLKLAFDGAPLILVITPALLLVAVRQRNELAAWLGAFCIAAILRPGLEILIHGSAASAPLSLSAPMILFALAGAGWLYHSLISVRQLVAVALIAGLIVSVGLIWRGMDVYPQQDMEQAFHSLVLRGAAPADTRGGIEVGLSQEYKMADYIRAHVHRAQSILTDDSQTYAVILLSGRSSIFRTALGSTYGNWEREVASPPPAVKFFLVASQDNGDRLRDAYIGAVAGRRRGISVVYRDQRYALLAVARGTTEKSSVIVRRARATQPWLITFDDHS